MDRNLIEKGYRTDKASLQQILIQLFMQNGQNQKPSDFHTPFPTLYSNTECEHTGMNDLLFRHV